MIVIVHWNFIIHTKLCCSHYACILLLVCCPVTDSSAVLMVCTTVKLRMVCVVLLLRQVERVWLRNIRQCWNGRQGTERPPSYNWWTTSRSKESNTSGGWWITAYCVNFIDLYCLYGKVGKSSLWQGLDTLALSPKTSWFCWVNPPRNENHPKLSTFSLLFH